MKHTLQRVFCALILLFGGLTISAGDDLRIALSADEVNEVVRASTPYLFIGNELSSLATVVSNIAPLATAEENTDALKVLAARFAKENKTASQELVKQALEEASIILEKHHQAITNDETLRTLAAHLSECKELLAQESLLITVQTDSELRAPRPELLPGGATGPVGTQFNSEELVTLPRDVNIERDLHVGNDLFVAGTINISGGTLYNSDIILQPLAPNTDIAIRFNDNAGNLITRFLSQPATPAHGLVVTENGAPYIHHTGDIADTNIFVGSHAGNLTVTGIENSGFGSGALISLATGTDNTAIGRRAGQLISTGINNTLVGYATGRYNNGSNNVCVGYNAGSAYTGVESNNICIGKDVAGIVGENSCIRIGAAAHTGGTYITGVNVSDGATALNIVGIDASNRLATSTTGGFGLTGDLTVTGQISTTYSGTGALPYAFLARGGNNHHTRLFGHATSGYADQARLTFNYHINNFSDTGTADVTNIGTGNISLDDSGIDFATNTAGVGLIPISRMHIASSGDVSIYNNFNLAAGTVITEGGIPYIHHTGPTPATNIFVGDNAGNLLVTGGSNSGFGVGALTALAGGTDNTAIGRNAGVVLSTGSTNTLIGSSTGSLLNGSNNVIVGYNAGSNYTTASNNICIGKDAVGVATETNTIRLGSSAHAATYITGINGVDVATTGNLVGVTSGHQLGTTGTTWTLTGNLDTTGNIHMKTKKLFSMNTAADVSSLTDSGIIYTNFHAPAFGVSNFDRINLAFNYYNVSNPSAPVIPNSGYGTAQITLGKDNTAGVGGAIVLGTSVLDNIAPAPRMAIRNTGSVEIYGNLAIGGVGAGTPTSRYVPVCYFPTENTAVIQYARVTDTGPTAIVDNGTTGMSVSKLGLGNYRVVYGHVYSFFIPIAIATPSSGVGNKMAVCTPGMASCDIVITNDLGALIDCDFSIITIGL